MLLLIRRPGLNMHEPEVTRGCREIVEKISCGLICNRVAYNMAPKGNWEVCWDFNQFERGVSRLVGG